ncbi:unnamed protein product [Linum tenue]|uniref:Uncharacterized protein n=1 Tax=Linum tenue TaxID=586396 RepID=A0AAV0KUP2_9ROSI|nr:unnamed protein product [Linum tenue]
MMNPSWPDSRVMDESCWSDIEHCRAIEKWYCVSKTEVESKAFEFGKANGLDVVSVCPNLILGPILQPTTNASTLLLAKLLKGSQPLKDRTWRIIGTTGWWMCDVAEALVLVYEKPEAQERYICTSHSVHIKDIVDILKDKYPNYNYPKK